ncbi:unnamed protein product [Closterium sp. NIES-64]|nr:unnamed protein product [Closterium sp. NIES-64]
MMTQFPASPHPLPCFPPSPSLLTPIPFPDSHHPLPFFPSSASLIHPIPCPAFPHPLPCFTPSPFLLPAIPFPAFPRPLPCFPPSPSLLPPILFTASLHPLPFFPLSPFQAPAIPFPAFPRPLPCFPPSPSLLPPILFPASLHPLPFFPLSPFLLPPIPFPVSPRPLPCFPPSPSLLPPIPFPASPHPLPLLPPYRLSTLPPTHLTAFPPYRLPTLPPSHLTTSSRSLLIRAQVWRKVHVVQSMFALGYDVVFADRAILWLLSPLPSLRGCQLAHRRRQLRSCNSLLALYHAATRTRMQKFFDDWILRSGVGGRHKGKHRVKAGRGCGKTMEMREGAGRLTGMLAAALAAYVRWGKAGLCCGGPGECRVVQQKARHFAMWPAETLMRCGI